MLFSHTVPKGWQRKSIADLFDVRASGDIDWSRWSTEQDANHLHPVYANGRADSGLHGYASYAVEKGDAITLTARGTLGELGFAFFRSIAFTPIGRLLVLKSKGEADARFFASYINGLVRFAQENTGVAQLTAPQVAHYQVDFPPLSEQHDIATALSDVDALIAGLEKLITKKRDIKQAAMQQLLTGQTRLPGFGGEWAVKTLAAVAPLQRGFDLTMPNLCPGPYPVVYSNGVLNHHDKFQVKGPGVVTGRSGTLGKVIFIESEYWPHNTSLWVTNFNGNEPKYVFYLYFRIDFRRFASGSGVPTLNRNDAHSFEAVIPPTRAEQKAIATVLSDMDTELSALESRLTKTRDLKQGMMQELLTGRTRLI